MKIRPLKKSDWPTVQRIYLEGMNTGMATFETEVPEWEIWDIKFLKKCRIVMVLENRVVGWAVLSSMSNRPVYKGVAEVSIYVDPKFSKKGIGLKLLEELIKDSEQEGFWTLQSSIFTENKVSIRLHEKLGFRIVGTRERIAKRDDKWKDTLLMERRSGLDFKY